MGEGANGSTDGHQTHEKIEAGDDEDPGGDEETVGRKIRFLSPAGAPALHVPGRVGAPAGWPHGGQEPTVGRRTVYCYRSCGGGGGPSCGNGLAPTGHLDAITPETLRAELSGLESRLYQATFVQAGAIVGALVGIAGIVVGVLRLFGSREAACSRT